MIFFFFFHFLSLSPLLYGQSTSTLRVNLNSLRLHRVLCLPFSFLHSLLSTLLPSFPFPILPYRTSTVFPFQTARRSCFSLLAIVVISQSSWEVVNCRQPSQTACYPPPTYVTHITQRATLAFSLAVLVSALANGSFPACVYRLCSTVRVGVHPHNLLSVTIAQCHVLEDTTELFNSVRYTISRVICNGAVLFPLFLFFSFLFSFSSFSSLSLPLPSPFLFLSPSRTLLSSVIGIAWLCTVRG